VSRRAAIAGILRTSPHTLIVCHTGPDGDCLGSALALARALRQLGRAATVGSGDGVPASLAFLPGAGQVVTRWTETAAPPVAVTMECSTLERCGVFAPVVARAGTIAAIDHHAGHEPYAHMTDWDPAAAAVGEQVAELIERLEVVVDHDMALGLLTALATDTGVFRFTNTTARVLRLAADLMDRGVALHEVVRPVYEEVPPSTIRLLGAALASVVLHDTGRVATVVITPQMLAAAGAGPDETAGIAAMLRTIAGVRLAATFEARGEVVRVSIRARDGARADRAAEALGGGGHAGAAGAEVRAPLDETVVRALAAFRDEVATAARGEGPAGAA
jgi:phosphoesterase RecJ-like protein